jgi:hypothetical protein
MPTQRNDLFIFTTSNPSVVNMDEPLSFIEGTEQGENDSRDECERVRSGFWKIGYGGEPWCRRRVTAEYNLTVLRAADAWDSCRHLCFAPNKDLARLRRLVVCRGPGPSSLCCLLVGPNVFQENSVHITLGGAASTSETPKAIGNLFMALISRPRVGEAIMGSSRQPSTFS